MKKFLLLLLIVCSLPTLILAQENKVYIYGEIVSKSSGLSSDMAVSVDLGEKDEQKTTDVYRWLVNDENREIRFNSIVDAMNHLSKDGWEYINSYSGTDGGRPTNNWVIRKAFDMLTLEEQLLFFQKTESMKIKSNAEIKAARRGEK